MDQFKAMTCFVCIVEQGSLSKAAEILNSSPSAVAKLLATLEKQLGLRLMNRTTRRISLTEEGSEYLAWCKHILREMDLMQSSLEARKQSIAGEIHISAPVEFGQLIIAPLVNAYLKEYPNVSIELNLSDQYEDIVQNNLDLAIRLGDLPDSSLIATRVGATQLVYCASPQFLTQYPINHPNDLHHAHFILSKSFRNKWTFHDQETRTVVNHRAILSTDQISVARQACINGLGVSCFYYYQVAEAIKTGQLVRILNHFNAQWVPIHFVYPHAKLISPRVKHLMDWLKSHIALYKLHDSFDAE